MFEGTGRLYEPASYAQAYIVTQFAYNSNSQLDDWWYGIRSKDGTCLFDSDETPADCSISTSTANIPSDDKCGYGFYYNSSATSREELSIYFYNCLDKSQFGTICEKSRHRN